MRLSAIKNVLKVWLLLVGGCAALGAIGWLLGGYRLSSLLVLIEKTLPGGGWMGRATGAVLVIWGAVTLAMAA